MLIVAWKKSEDPNLAHATAWERVSASLPVSSSGIPQHSMMDLSGLCEVVGFFLAHIAAAWGESIFHIDITLVWYCYVPSVIKNFASW